MSPSIGASPGSAFDLERLGQRDFLGAADVNRMPLVDRSGGDVEDSLLAGRAAASRLFRDHREGGQLVHQPQFALGLAALCDFAGIHINSALEQASMEVGGECSAVSKGIASPFIFATGNMRKKFARALVPLARIRLVDGIGTAVRGHLNVLFPQNEFAERSI